MGDRPTPGAIFPSRWRRAPKAKRSSGDGRRRAGRWPWSPGPAAASARPSPSIWPRPASTWPSGPGPCTKARSGSTRRPWPGPTPGPSPGRSTPPAALIEAGGPRALPVYLDLLDRAVPRSPRWPPCLEQWGRIDVLVNNGRYVGPGHMDQVLDTPVELLDRHLEANVMAPVILAKLVAAPDGRARAAGRSSTWPRARGRWILPRRPGTAAGDSATACPRRRCTGWPASWPWSSATGASVPTT